MTDWRPLPEAPRSGEDGNPVLVRLYLPGVPPSSNSECTGIWDGEHWIDRATGQRVYPSQWAPLS